MNQNSVEQRMEESCNEMEKSLQRMHRDIVEDLSVYIKAKVELEVRKILNNLLNSDREKLQQNLQCLPNLTSTDKELQISINEIKIMLQELKNNVLKDCNHVSASQNDHLIEPQLSAVEPPKVVSSKRFSEPPNLAVNSSLPPKAENRFIKYSSQRLNDANNGIEKPKVEEDLSLKSDEKKVDAIVIGKSNTSLHDVVSDSRALEFLKKYRISSRSYFVKLQVDEDNAEALGLYATWEDWQEDREGAVNNVWLEASMGQATYVADLIPGESSKYYVAPVVHRFPNMAKAIQTALFKFFDYDNTVEDISSKNIILLKPATIEKISDDKYVLVDRGVLSC